jgi:hypothetical protein
MSENTEWKRNTLIIGGLIGAIIGVISAVLIVKEVEENEDATAISPAKGMRLGMLVMNFLRQITKA